MKIQAEVSLYPLRRASLEESIDCFVQHLRRRGFRVKVGPMSSQISGESGNVFHALAKAFEEVAHGADVVLTMKVSNACPQDANNSKDSGNEGFN